MRADEPDEISLPLAEREVRESEDRVAWQFCLVLALERDGAWQEAQAARRVLTGFQDRLGLAWERLQMERWVHDHKR